MAPFEISNDIFILYHQLWRSLQEGLSPPYPSPRSPLPAELVRIIVRYAGLAVPDRTLTATVSTRVDVRCKLGPYKVTIVWFYTKPLTSTALANIAQVQLVTVSGDQGWTTDQNPVSRTWYDVGIFPEPPQETTTSVTNEENRAKAGRFSGNGSNEPAADIRWTPARKNKADDWSWMLANRDIQKHFNQQDDMRWQCSHFNPCAHRKAEHRDGQVFEKDHQLWEGVKSGDVIAIRVGTQYLNWVNSAHRGELRVWKYFEPVLLV
ncbi:hypothetical protein NM688_g8531 [Phlebia brevispora]|uniref:Uncharacterized protein n=1 Tax=Phlebia brevispora TaxID=194682 RepID=A0ACC1RSA7_9APHY|nr:hypothetical protein NM688_g8531 [Phlebia brevispora]